MNANELADNWETKLKPHERHNTREETMYWVNQYRLFGDTAATMLRQLQAENEALKKEAALQRLSDFTQEATKILTDEEYEKLMQQWDYWRKQIADGDKSSAPRDWFECVIELLLKQY